MAAMLAGTAVIDVIVLTALGITAGRSATDGERAALYAGIAYLLVAVAAAVLYWSLNPAYTLMSRILATGLFFVLECLVAVLMVFITLIVLNR